MEDASIQVPEAGGVFPPARRLRSVVVGLIALLSGCDRTAPPAALPHPVGVVRLSTQRVPVHVPLPGRVSAWRVAEVRPQVSGILLQRRFSEGSGVRAGEPLYLIDPAPYQAALAQATGNLARSRAAARQANRTASRYRALLGTNYISQQDVDMAVAQARQADAQVTADRAAVDRATLNLNYTDVRAPVDGVTGKSFFTEGALVTDGQPQPMTVIQQLDPVYVDLTEDSDAWLRLRQELHYGAVTPAAGQRIPVTVNVGSGKHAMSVNCSLLFSDVTVDVSTGALVLRAQCPNPEHTLLPGMFVRAVVSPGVRENALLVPQQAVSRTPDGQATVMVVDKDNRAQLRPVRVAEATGDQWRVTEGLSAGEQVVVTGQLMLRPGMPVTVRSPVPGDNVRTGSLASRDAGLPADEAAAEDAARKEKEHA